MDGAHFADKGGAEVPEHLVDGGEGLGETRDRVGGLRPLGSILSERDQFRYFVRPPVKFRRATKRTDHVDESPVKFGNRHRAEGELRASPIGRCTPHGVIEKIEI
jgi:hypothetical protein